MSRTEDTPGVHRCDVCEKLVTSGRLERHLQVCARRPYSTDGTCPMCGDEYESYTSHLQVCEPRKQ